MVYLAATDPYPGPKPLGYLSNYPLDMPAAAVVDRVAPALAATRYYADAYPYFWLNFGPGIVAGFLGSVVHSVSEPSETVWFSPHGPTDLAELTLAYDPDNVWWRRVQEVAQRSRCGTAARLGTPIRRQSGYPGFTA